MADYQLCELDEFLVDINDGFISPDEYMESIKPKIEETIQIPEAEIFQNSTIDNAEKVVEGEITKMLRIAPGILPAVDCFPKSYKPPKPANLPEFIPCDRYNKIPILLDEKFFKFGHDGDDVIKTVNQNVRETVNNLDGGGNVNVNGNGKSKNSQNRTSKINGGGNQSSASSEALAKRFFNVFCSDTSDEDNCNVRSSPNPPSHQKQVPQETVKPVQEYYNARQLYELKRGKKQ